MTTGVPAYSITPASNVQANTGVNWDEGMSPGAVNNSARANMADLRTAFNDLIWFQYGGGTSPVVTPAYASGTSFTVAGIDVTTPYHAGRRVKAVGSGTGTIYGSVSSSSFSTNTTVNVTWDSGSLTNEALTIYLSQVPITGVPLSGPIAFPATQIPSSNVNTLDDYEEGTWTPTDASGATLTLSTALGRYIKIGQSVFVSFKVVYPVTVDATGAKIGGLPFTASNSIAADMDGLSCRFTDSNRGDNALIARNTTTAAFFGTSGSAVPNSQYSGKTLTYSGWYQAAA